MGVLRFKPRKSLRDTDRILRFLVQSAADHISAYRDLLAEAGVSASSVTGREDLPSLPILTKERLFRNAEPACRLHENINHSRCIQVSTGGYTGMPVKIYLTHSEMLFRRLQLLTEWRRLVRLPLALRVADVGSWVDSESGCSTARHGPISVLRVSNGLPMKQQVQVISRYAPHVISGYPSTTALLAEEWERSKTPHSPLLVATRGEVLHDWERTTVSTGFGSRIADFYNCEEIGNIASECGVNPGALHINTDACIVEIVDKEGLPVSPGCEGRILVTNLYSHTMPFLRYHVGDRGMLLSPAGEMCACGSRRPKMAVVEGREDDYVVLQDGQRLSPRLVATTVKRNLDARAKEVGRDRFFTRMQIVHDAVDHLTVRMVQEGEWPDDLDDLISGKLTNLHPSLSCTVTAVDSIPREPSGKFKKVVRRMDA